MLLTFQADETQRRSFLVGTEVECPAVMGDDLEHT
jgi:hypothetical protein